MSAPDPAAVQPARKPWKRVALGLAAGVGVAAAAMIGLGISHREVLDELRRSAWHPLLFAAAGSLGLLAFQALRWWLVMRPVVRLRYRDAYALLAMSFFFNSFIPGRGGDLLRVQVLGKGTGTSRAKLLGTEVVDICSDKWGWLVAFVAVCLFGVPPGWLLRALGLLAAVVVVGSAGLVLLASDAWRRKRSGGARGPAWLANVRDGLAAQSWRRLLLVELLVAPLPWLWETLLVAVAARSMGLSLSPMEAFATLTGFNLGLVIPSPGNLGSLESAGTVALAQLGVARPTAAAFMFLHHMTQLLPGIALGGALVAVRGRSLIGRRAQPESEAGAASIAS